MVHGAETIGAAFVMRNLNRLCTAGCRARLMQVMTPADTSADAAAVQHEIFRRMTTAQRLRMALEMSESMRSVALAGLRSRRPELSAEELSRELLRIMYGFVAPL